MLGIYSLLVSFDLSVDAVIVIFGSFVSGMMLLVMHWHARNQKIKDSLSLIGEEKRH